MKQIFTLSVLTSFLFLGCASGGGSAVSYDTISTEGYKRKPMNRKVQKQFPFDIDVRVSEDRIANTQEIFANRKKPLVLSFWLTTCAPCYGKFNAFSKKYDEMKAVVDFDYYGVSIDYDDNADAVFSSAAKNGWPFPILHDLNREFRRAMPGGLNGMPQTFVFDASGKIVLHQMKGESLDFDKLTETLIAASK